MGTELIPALEDSFASQSYDFIFLDYSNFHDQEIILVLKEA